MVLWLGVPVVVVILLAVGMAAVSRNYRTPRVLHRRDPGASNIAFSEIRFPTEGGKELYGWWIPVEGRENAPTPGSGPRLGAQRRAPPPARPGSLRLQPRPPVLAAGHGSIQKSPRAIGTTVILLI